MDYNGEELAVAAFQDGWYMPSNQCSFASPFINTGLAYAGHYQHSLDIADRFFTSRGRPVDENSLTVTWGEVKQIQEGNNTELQGGMERKANLYENRASGKPVVLPDSRA